MEFDFSVRNVLRKRLGILNTNQAMRHGRCVVQMHALSITPLLFLLLFVSSYLVYHHTPLEKTSYVFCFPNSSTLRPTPLDTHR